MSKTSRLGLSLLRWVARLTSLASLGVLLMFFIGEGFYPTQVAWQDWIGLAFFPFGVAAGMVLAWWKELPGGVVTLVSLAGFYLVYSLLLYGEFPDGPAFAIFSLPGVLFLICAVWKNLLTSE